MNRLSEKQMANLIDYLEINKNVFHGCGRAYIAKTATKELRYKVNANNIIRAQKRAGLTPIKVGRPSKAEFDKNFIGPPKPIKVDEIKLSEAFEYAYKQINKKSALDVQIGGDHYSKMAIQPIEYILKNNLGYCEANVVKYISRWKDKGGVQDLEKAKHYIDMLIAQN